MKSKQIKLSSQYKWQIAKVVMTILGMLIIYLALILAVIGLSFGFMFAGGAVIVLHPSFLTLALGAGLIAAGFVLLIFITKFAYQLRGKDTSILYEVDETKAPQLFQMIEELVTEVGTNFPKRVYLSHDVNASVFYNSTFWSMFFPVKKNLVIGMGLINMVTVDELKAILAHEFGHFSQSSMKIGSYVYHVNKVIYDMLFDNDDFYQSLDKWREMHSIFDVLISVAIGITRLIQVVLKWCYNLVNKNYLALSREMEFNADEIAVSVMGSEPLKTSLIRMSLADYSFNEVLEYYNKKFSDCQISQNLYKDQQQVIQYIAQMHELPMNQHIPQVSMFVLKKYERSKLVLEDQWSSHPSLDERIERMEKLDYLSKEVNQQPANELLENLQFLQEKISFLYFAEVIYPSKVQKIESKDFFEAYEKENKYEPYAEMYNSYYDRKNIFFFDINECDERVPVAHVQTLFSDEKVECVHILNSLDSDIQTLKNIESGKIDVKTFDYDGVKYKHIDAGKLADQLVEEKLQYQNLLLENEKDIYRYFLYLEEQQGLPSKIRQVYQNYMNFLNGYDDNLNLYIEMYQKLEFIHVVTPFPTISENFKRLKPFEQTLKFRLETFMKDEDMSHEFTPEAREILEKYCNNEWVYFKDNEYQDEPIQLLANSIEIFYFLFHKKLDLLKNEILNYSAQLQNQCLLVS